ncbi:MAG: gliding motility-associated C-terminal domain-containing protein [Fibrobacter sp.]|nr:gliding motility-associated C-terminal domain-containing protein [Fibrobacter sp.]
MKLIPRILFVLFFVSQVMSAEVWQSTSNPFPIYDGVPYGEGVMLATGGGVRYRALNADEMFHSEDGLETSKIFSIVTTKSGILAISEYGQVAVFEDYKRSWRVLNRAYVSNKSRIVAGSVIAAEYVLVLPFEDRLAFFDLQRGTSIITINRIGSKPLAVDGVTGMAIHGDSLYVRLTEDVYVRKMNWNDMMQDSRLNDPESWNNLGPKDIDGLIMRDSVWSIDTKHGSFEITSESIHYVNGSLEEDLSARQDISMHSFYEVTNLPNGGFLAATTYGRFGASDASNWWYSSQAYEGHGSFEAASNLRMKVLSALPNGYIFFHPWGQGFFIFDKDGHEMVYSFKPGEGHCFDEFVENFPVAFSSIPAPDGSGFLTASLSNKGYSLVYFTKNGEVHCAKNIGSMIAGGPMYAKIEEDGSWVVYVGTKESFGYAEEGGLDVVRFAAPKSHGNELVNVKVKSVGGIYPSPSDAAFDSVGKRLWLVSSSTIAYYDEDADTLYSPTSINGVLGADFTSIEADVHGNLWVGTSNQGVYRLSLKGKSPDSLSTIRYTTKNGLFDDDVKDLAIDPVLGIACFAHENGMSCVRRNDLKNSKGNMTDSAKVDVAAYPIPFRPKIHQAFVIENIAENASVSIYNRGGSLIRYFHGEEVYGGRIDWDGKGKDGKLVTPGVYYYVVKSPSKVKKGKFIVIH